MKDKLVVVLLNNMPVRKRMMQRRAWDEALKVILKVIINGPDSKGE